MLPEPKMATGTVSIASPYNFLTWMIIVHRPLSHTHSHETSVQRFVCEYLSRHCTHRSEENYPTAELDVPMVEEIFRRELFDLLNLAIDHPLNNSTIKILADCAVTERSAIRAPRITSRKMRKSARSVQRD